MGTKFRAPTPAYGRPSGGGELKKFRTSRYDPLPGGVPNGQGG
ncbi:MAG: hypothetical protein WC299_05295 [Kiritimatiellia bacterium]